MKIDFLAIEKHHAEHALAIWRHIKNKGDFFTSKRAGKVPIKNAMAYKGAESIKGDNPIAVFCYGDLKKANSAGRDRIIFGEHGVGHSYVPPHPSYAGSLVDKGNVKLLLCQNQTVYDSYFRYLANKEPVDLLPRAKKVIIGVPKMDGWAKKKFRVNKKDPVVAISFHWDALVCDETRSALSFYVEDLPVLKRHFRVIGHGHPRIMPELKKVYGKAGIEVEEDFNRVIKRADVYVCDNSSTIFEFAFVGKPVVLMNCPFYEKVRNRKRGHNFRFWDYADIGPEVNSVREIILAIPKSFDRLYGPRRKRAVKDIFTYLDGRCGIRAARAIENLFSKGRSNNRLRN